MMVQLQEEKTVKFPTSCFYSDLIRFFSFLFYLAGITLDLTVKRKQRADCLQL